MLIDREHLLHCRLGAQDGEIGRIVDLYFDDQAWIVRYFVADTGFWLQGRHVLISPEAAQRPNWNGSVLPVRLTREQVETSPGVDVSMPVSRQLETALAHHFGWAPYWQTSPEGRRMATDESVTRTRLDAQEGRLTKPPEGDPHLRSVNEIRSYRIEATDGLLGSCESVLVHAVDWRLTHLVVETGSWLAGRRVVVPCENVGTIDWALQRVRMKLDRETIRRSPPYDRAAVMSPDYEKRLNEHYRESA